MPGPQKVNEISDRRRGVWTLIEQGSCPLLEKTVPGTFDYRSLHPERKITVLQALLDNAVSKLEEPFLEAAAFLMRRGADPFQRAPEDCTYFAGPYIYDEGKGEITKKFTYARKSALDLVFEMKDEFRRLIKAKKGPWEGCVGKMESFIKIFEENVCSEPSGDRVSVAEETVSHWESIMEDKESCDITLKCAEDNTVMCHSFMLKRVSPVVSAMLEVGMTENQSKTIDVQDVSIESVKLLLEFCYCGCVRDKTRSCKLLLDCLDLAHRWQIDFAVSMLEKLLIPKVAPSSFDNLCEAASLKDLTMLKPALREFEKITTQNRNLIRTHPLKNQCQIINQY